MTRITMIGFNFGNRKYKWQQDWDYPEPIPQKFCPYHPGVPVVPMKGKDSELLFCCQCGSPYLPKDTISEERLDAQVGPTDKSMIVSGKKKKKFYDKQGNLITDPPELIKDIRQGKT